MPTKQVVDPEFAPLMAECYRVFDDLWSLPLKDFKEAWTVPPASYPPEVPQLSELISSIRQVPVTDEATVEIQIYSPKTNQKGLPLFFVTHGGGWVVGSHSMEESMTRSVCVQNDCVVVSVDYRMAPEFPFPFAVEDSWRALKWCKEHAAELNINPNHIILGGASAGANLAAILALRAKTEGLVGIVGQVLNIPVTCHPDLFPTSLYTYQSWVENRDAPIVNAERMRWFWDQYLREVGHNPDHSPLLAESHSKLPPALVQVSGLDPLRDEGLAYAEALKRAGVAVELNIYPGLPHGFSMYPQLSQSGPYRKRVVDWVAKIIANLAP